MSDHEVKTASLFKMTKGLYF